HREGLSLVDTFEATRNTLDGLDALLDRRLADAERTCRGGPRKRVLHVEAPGELQLDARKCIVGAKPHRVRELGCKTRAVFVANVDDRMLSLGEQTPFGFEVLLHRPV